MVACLYISEFPAWALQRERPDLRSIAVHHEGRIIARSRLLAQSGMLLGDPLERARAVFPEACFFTRDALFEHAVWEGVMHHINDATPFIESIDRGVAFFRPYDFSEVCALAGQLVGRVGLGPNKSIARIAAARSAPGSVLQIREDAVPCFLSRTGVAVLSELGFDEDIAARLELFGLTNLESVRALTLRHLRVQFGPSGAALFDLLHPASDAAHVPAYAPPATITEIFHFDSGSRDSAHLSRVLDWMVDRAVLRLGRSSCTRLALRVQVVERKHVPAFSQRALKGPTSDPGIIGRAASHLLQNALRSPVEVASIELALGGLESRRYTQGSLFFERPPLDTAIERLDERFPGALRRALIVHPDAPFPEDGIRFVAFSDSVAKP